MPVPLEEAIRNMKVIEAIFRSAEIGQWVTLVASIRRCASRPIRVYVLHRVVAVGGVCPGLCRRWQLAVIPSSAESLHQLHGRQHLLNLQRFSVTLVTEQRGLRGDDIDIGIDTGVVTLHLQIEELLRGL